MNELEQKIAQARRRYIASLPDKAQAVTAAVDAADRETLCTLAHRLAGSAGLHELAGLQASAAALDALCDQQAPMRELDAAAATLLEALQQAQARE